MTPAAAVGDRSVVGLHPLLVRPDDDDPQYIVAGRPEIGEFAEMPALCGEIIRLLGDGLTVAAVEEEIARRHGVGVGVAGVVDTMREMGFVASIDGQPLPDPAQGAPRPHLGSLSRTSVSWLFSRPVVLLWWAIVAAAVLTLLTRPDVFPGYEDFFWNEHVGFVVLVNTAMFSVVVTVHELMHLFAARSLDAPARISFGTRLHHLVMQTDVTAIWGVPRRARYRVYLAGMAWDVLLIAALVLLLAHAPPPEPVAALLRALMLAVLLSVALQAHVYMRSDLYFVLRDLLRCRNLFDQGLAYARYLLARAVSAVRGRGRPADPSTVLPPHERRATRLYSVFLAGGAGVALAMYAFYGVPIVVSSLVRAVTALAAGFQGGPLLTAVDAAMFLLVEGGLQLLYVVTFLRSHRHWFRRPARTG
ncbi:hypothetical protein ABGB14_32300 [Nonomuraea sp. B10E15]|uniref:hypothetical protein n=1 Tax=Nonomuraea sp. B10E15 TaxID=3153560 RepID=UPI00325D19AA